MKRKLKKRITAFLLCMVLVVCNSVSILADEPVATAVESAETKEQEKATKEEKAPEATTAAKEKTTEKAPETTTAKKEETTTEKAPEATTAKKEEKTTEKAPETTTAKKEETTTEKAPEATTAKKEETTTEKAPETTEEKVFCEAFKLEKEIRDEKGNLVQKVTAQIPAKAFKANKNQITMEVAEVDATTEKHIQKLIEKRLPEKNELGDYMLYQINFKVDGKTVDALEPITITFEKSDLEIKEKKKANVFYYNEKENTEKITEIIQKKEMIEKLQAEGKDTDDLREYKFSEIEVGADYRSDEIRLKGEKSAIYGCYVEKSINIPVLTYENEEVIVSVTADEEGIIPADAQLKVVSITAENTDTQQQYTEVEQKIKDKVAQQGKEVSGFLAYDIAFVNAEGQEVEPDGKVQVSMKYKEAVLPPANANEGEAPSPANAEADTTADANATDVSVFHLEEDEQGNVSQVVDMKEEQKATVETLSTAEGEKVQKVQVETESFSVFTITWTYSGQSKFTITAKYVDASGKEIDVTDPQTNITIGNNETINLEQYWRDADGYSKGKITVDTVGGTEITGLQSSSQDKNFIITWTEYYIKYKAKDSTQYTDWLKAGNKLEGENTEGTIYFVYNSPTANISLNIVDNIIEDGSLTSEISGTYASEISGYEWYSSDSENGTYTLIEKKSFRGGKTNISDDGTKLYPAFDDGAQKWYKVKVTYTDGATVESAPYQVPYFDSLQNGGFEDVLVYNNERVSNAYYKNKGGVWQSTKGGRENEDKEDKHIEILVTETENDKQKLRDNFAWGKDLPVEDAEEESGTVRFAEINCSAAGALYQDVLTIDDQTLNYWLSHRARGTNNTRTEHDEMYLVIMPTKIAVESDLNEQNNLNSYLTGTLGITLSTQAPTREDEKILYKDNGILVVRISSDDQNWHDIQGIAGYTPTTSLTRFFFMAGATASNNVCVGNFVDRVGFSQDLPKPEDGKFNFTIEKHFEGLGNADLTEIQNKIQFRISVMNNGTQLTDEQVKTLFGVDSVVIKGSDMKADLNGNLTKSFVDRPITNFNNVYEITVTEENAELSSYVVNSSYTTSVSQNSGQPTIISEEGVTATVSNIKGKTGATIDFTNTYESTNYKKVNFTKVWDDKHNEFETRPDSLEVTLHGSVSYVDESGETVTKNLTAEELGVDATQTLNQAGEWKTFWEVPVYYEVTHSDGTIAKIKIHYTVTEGTINSGYVYEAGELQNGTGEGYSYDDFNGVTITGDGQAVTKLASASRLSKGRSLMTLSDVNENELGEPNHRKYIVYNEATGDYTLNLDVTGKKGEAKGVDVLFVIDTSGSMSDNNLLRKVQNLLTENNGVVDKILGGENNVNSVAYVSFAGKSETKTSSWYGANNKETLKSQINRLRATGGTNWTYAMMKADEKLAERANSGNEKVMIFLSDGEPTYSIKADGSQYGKGSSTRDVYYTEAIGKVTGSTALKSAQKYSVYLTSDTKDGMSKFATGTGAELVDGTQLETALSTILNKIIPTYTNVSIEDTLSQYVEFTEGNNPTITVYKDNERLPESAYSVERNGKTVKVSFNGELEDGATYRISFRVKPSQEANDKYVNDGYTDTGDAGTGTTSAGQEGFYSNGEAKLTYSIKGTENNDLTATYKKPVVQITTHSLTFEKKWNKPQDVITPNSVTLNVAYTDGINEQITLTQENNWTVTKNNVPVTRKIQSVTEVALNDYTPSYEISGDGTKATVTNSYSKITTKNMTVNKIWSGNGPQTEVTVSLYRRKNDNSAEQLYESVVLNEQNGWTHTWKDLPSIDWLGEKNFSYAVREEEIPENYTSNISYKTEGDTTTVTIDNVYDTNCADENFYIANKLQTIPLTVTKTWSDGNNVQGERPESLGVTVREGDHTLQFTLSADNNWTKNVRVPKRSDSNYTATEDLTGIANYTPVDSSVNATDNAVYVSFTNQINTTSVTVNKVWVDGNPENRPGSIEFVLKRNGGVYDHYTLSEEDNDGNGNSWTKVIEGLPVTGTYTVEEVGWGTDESDTIYDYNSKVTGFTITNTLNWHIIKTSESLAGEPTVNLAGAEFELKKDENVIATGTSDSKGVVQWADSPDLTSLDGDYQLVETKAPNGYVLHENGWTLSFENGLLKSVKDNKDGTVTNATYDAIEGACVNVTNTKIYSLPSTGGNGIYWYTIGGMALMMGAALILYKDKRKRMVLLKR